MSDVTLDIGVTGNAEAQLKKIASAASDLEKKGGVSLAQFGEIGEKAFEVFKEGLGVFALYEGAKKALDLTFEAESIHALNTQFGLLARGAGISSEALKKGLEEAASGLIDDTSLIKLANGAIAEMGANAAKLPPIMELARKATSIFGGDLASNFQAIEHAIASGQTRALKQLGIVIDSSTAYRQFAASIGTTAELLSETGKQQAILNAVLAEGKKKFSDIDVDLKQGTDTFQRFKTTLVEIGETATLAFDKAFGRQTRSILSGFQSAAKDAQIALKASFGDGAEQAAAQVEQLENRIASLKKRMDEVSSGKQGLGSAESKIQIDLLNVSLKKAEGELSAAKGKQEAFTDSQEKAVSATKKNKDALIDFAAQQAKLAEEGKKVSERLANDDASVKYKKDLAALLAYYGAKGQLDQQDFDALDKLGEERDKKNAEHVQHQLDELNGRNDSLKALNTDLFQSEIDGNQAKINKILAQEDQHSAVYLKQKKKESDDEIKIRKLTTDTVSGILGNAAIAAKAFGEEGFAVFKALAEAQAIVNTYASATAAYLSAAEIPIVGAVLAPIAAAAAIAAGLANVAQINATHLATGIDEVPAGFERDNFPAMLQTGERVVPKDTNKDLKAFLAGDSPMVALLASINDKLSNQHGVSVQIDGREVFNAMRSQLRSGRAFA